jgi:hypothetical protein
MKRVAMVLVVVLGLSFGLLSPAADFDGDGIGDLAVFRSGSGLWAIRGVTRLYFGTSGDVPVPGNYSGLAPDQPAIFRPGSGLWAVRGVTRVYFGGSGDEVIPGDYDGNGRYDFAIFRPASGRSGVLPGLISGRPRISRLPRGRPGAVCPQPGRPNLAIRATTGIIRPGVPSGTRAILT